MEERSIEKIKREIIFFVMIVIVASFIIVSQSDFIGISTSHVEEEARKNQRIPDSWEVVQSRTDELYALLFYEPNNRDAYAYSLYVNKKGFSFGYFFHSGGDISGISDTSIYYVYENKGRVLVSLNKQRIQKIERDNGERGVLEIDVNKPVIVTFPVDGGIIDLYDETGKEVLYERVIQKW